MASRLLKMTLDEPDAARDWAELLGRMTAREKVAIFLISLARRQAAAGDPLGGPVTMHLPLSREAMGDHLGLTIETASRQMIALRKDGPIEMPSSRNIRMPAFRALATEPVTTAMAKAVSSSRRQRATSRVTGASRSMARLTPPRAMSRSRRLP